jgi:hypothetical protein
VGEKRKGRSAGLARVLTGFQPRVLREIGKSFLNFQILYRLQICLNLNQN